MHPVYLGMVEENARLIVRRAYMIVRPESPYSPSLPHTHDCLEITYINCEYCNYYIGGKKYVLNRRDLIVVNSTIPHHVEWVTADDRPLYGIAFAQGAPHEQALSFGDMLRSSPSVHRFFDELQDIVIIPGAEEIYQALTGLTGEIWSNNDIGYQNILLNKLLIDIARMHQEPSRSQVRHVDRIRRYIDENYHAITCVEDIAREVGLNKNHVQRLFKKQMGGTVWQYLTDVRMRSAAALLRDSDIAIGEIDSRVGIQSRQNFYLLFKKAFGISPQQYRRLSKSPYNA